MHGVVHYHLKQFVIKHAGEPAWHAILNEAGIGNKNYLITKIYPDEETISIIKTAARLTRTPAVTILEEFGKFLVPELMNAYKALIRPDWKTMELLLNTEDTIHRVVRLRNPGAQPPKLDFRQTGPNELLFFYSSPRRMSALAKGMIQGVANFFHEQISISEDKKPDGTNTMKITIL